MIHTLVLEKGSIGWELLAGDISAFPRSSFVVVGFRQRYARVLIARAARQPDQTQSANDMPLT
jgi:hypothetical protein